MNDSKECFWICGLQRFSFVVVFTFCLWTGTSAQTIVDLIDKADTLLKAGDYQGYLAIGMHFAKSDTLVLSGIGLQMMAQAYGYLEKDSLALANFNEAHKILKNDSYLLGTKARFFLNNYELDSALNNYSLALINLKSYDDSLHVSGLLLDLGIILKKKRQYDDAIQTLSESIRYDSSNFRPYYHLGEVYLYKNDYKKSVIFCDLAKSRGGNSVDLKYVEASSLSLLGDNRQAIEIARSILSDTSIALSTNLLLGEIYLSIDSAQMAISHFRDALMIDPDNVGALNNIAFVNMNLGHFKEAIEYFDKCIKVDPDFAFAYNNKAFCQYSLGLHQEALRNCNKSLEIDSENSWAYVNRAKIYFALSMSSRGCIDLKKARSMNYPKKEELLELEKKCDN